MEELNLKKLEELARLLRYYILTTTTEAGSGHPTSSLSAVELMAVLMFGGYFKYDIKNPKYHNNDRLIFSKGHATPLYYPLWYLAGGINEDDLYTLRKFKSTLEGHPTPAFKFADVATGSLGQGLSIGCGMALNAKYLDQTNYQTYVLLGDGELEEGSIWEAAEFASKYMLSNLTAIVDVNRLEQIGETIEGWNLESYRKKFEAFGWDCLVVNDGHNLREIINAFENLKLLKEKPVAIIAKTIKGKGFSLWENQLNYHSKVLTKSQLQDALKELGKVDLSLKAELKMPDQMQKKEIEIKKVDEESFTVGDKVATRNAYGKGLANILLKYPNIIALDAGLSNSTYAQDFAQLEEKRYFECYIAEQNMVGVATGLSAMGKLPFVSTFASFFTRAMDQVRMSAYSNSNIKYIGSHPGVSIGADGVSQMGLEDIAMFRALPNCILLYPSDAVSMAKMLDLVAAYKGNTYIRMTRKDATVLYKPTDSFEIGGSKILRESVYDLVTVIGAGVTLQEALKAYDTLANENIFIRVVDLYSIKPMDNRTLTKCVRETKAMLVVEDHYSEGGICEAIRSELPNTKSKIYSLAVNKMPHSGTPDELLDYEEISSNAIVKFVKDFIISNTPSSY